MRSWRATRSPAGRSPRGTHLKARRRRPARPDARQAAFEILLRVDEAGAYASVLLERTEGRLDDPREAALLHETVLGVLRMRAVLDHALERAASRPVAAMDGPLKAALRIGAYGLLYLDRVPDFAAVDTTVELVKRNGPRAAIGLANAVMRRIAAEGKGSLPPEPAAGDVAGLALRHSHPAWWVDRLAARLGWERAERLLRADNAPASTVLRPNLRRTTPRDLALRLEGEGIATEPGRFATDALRVRAGAVHRSRSLRDGFAWVQDEASQLVPRLFGRVLRPRVADLCAAPGSKTLVLAESVPEGGFVVAADRHPGRLRRLLENVRRVEAQGVLALAADMAAASPLAGPFDHVLLDAPCGGTGTLRRHPEIRWRLTPADLPLLAARQAKLLDAAARLVARGGTLVYSVCSLEPEEGEEAIAAFLRRHGGFRCADAEAALPPPARTLLGTDGALRTFPDEGGLDGFFAALLERTG